MNIFIISQLDPKPSGQELISLMSCINLEQGTRVPVVVVDDRFNLRDFSGSGPAEHAQFKLEEFQSDSISSSVEPNKVAERMDSIDSRWVLIDFGRHDHETCTDFILKLSRYSYLNSKLRNCSIIFSVPVVTLGMYARALNESFNNLSISNSALADSSQIRKLIMVIHFERVLASLPMPRNILRRIRQIFQRIYSYFLKVV